MQREDVRERIPEYMVEDAVTKKVVYWCNYLQNYFLKAEDWRQVIEDQIQQASQGKIRAFYTFFDSPEELFEGKFTPCVLTESDTDFMFPGYKEDILSVEQDKIMYFFVCNGAYNKTHNFVSTCIL